MKKNKTPIVQISTRAEAETIMTCLALVTNANRATIAKRDALVVEANAKFATALEQQEAEIKAHTTALSLWIEANPDEFPKGKKTLELTNGTITQRTGTPALKLLRGWTWERALGAVMSRLPNFTRQVPEIDKAGIIATRDELEKLGVLPLCGLKIDQGEKLHIQPKLTELETKQTVTT